MLYIYIYIIIFTSKTNTNPLNITDDIFHGLEDNPRFVLNQVSLPILNDRVCGAHNWYGSEFLPQTTFCAGYEQGGKDACLVSFNKYMNMYIVFIVNIDILILNRIQVK